MEMTRSLRRRKMEMNGTIFVVNVASTRLKVGTIRTEHRTTDREDVEEVIAHGVAVVIAAVDLTADISEVVSEETTLAPVTRVGAE